MLTREKLAETLGELEQELAEAQRQERAILAARLRLEGAVALARQWYGDCEEPVQEPVQEPAQEPVQEEVTGGVAD